MTYTKSRVRTPHGRADWKLPVPVVVTCADTACGLMTPPHAACRHCGTLRGAEVPSRA
ncbi:50S ribosomal protein L32 [Streptomyces sp. NRRL F-5727]|uniref:50S ribosomal protein L32 n=1 Tax=Streptomyces sp. NRRL F-5727 TaxID=1463871 RepID=UPI0007C65A35|nr:50S ribosomal protein L32 [Streptomyces sp. NRRL F-5727]